MTREIAFSYEGVDYKVEVERVGSRLLLTRNGERYQVELDQDPVSQDEKVSEGSYTNEFLVARPRSSPKPVPHSSPATTPPVAPSVGASSSDGECSPIAGTVKEIKVAQGDAVKKGELIVVMEAMKMDIEVFAGLTGKVDSIVVSQGESVKMGQTLMTLIETA